MPGTRWPKDPIIFESAPSLPSKMTLRYCPALADAWRFSADRLNNLARRLEKEFDAPWFGIAVAGSYGRMDAGPNSDADFILLVCGAPSQKAINDTIEKCRSLLKELGFALPNPKGSFSAPLDISKLTESIGHTNDSLIDLARRMVFLMEIKALYNEPLVEAAVNILLDHYLRYQKKEPEKQPLFLLNEVIRFFRSICVNYELNFWHEHEKWAIRNAKLRHSRIVIYFGLLSLLLNCSKKKDKLGYLKRNIRLTPLERICHVYDECGEIDVARVLGPYDIFVKNMSDPDFRKRLSQAEYHTRYNSQEYALLKTTSEALAAELTRFVFDQRGNWPQKILGYLIF